MSFILPDDIILDLQKSYPDHDIKKITNDLFNLILQKSLKDGACLIRGFGKFVAFQTFSTKLCKDVIRFKFKISHSLLSKIICDPFLYNNLKKHKNNIFNEKNRTKCYTLDAQNKKSENIKKSIIASQKSRKKTNEKLAKEEILQILNKE